MGAFAAYTFNTGLSSQGTNGARPTLFELNGELYLYNGGKQNAWKWNSTSNTWEVNTTLATFDVAPGNYAGPVAFWYNSELYMIVCTSSGALGYKWNNTNQQWEQDNSITSGISGLNASNQGTYFEIASDRYLIFGDSLGTFTGFKWNGSSWSTDSTIQTGLVDSGGKGNPCSFYFNDDLYLVANRTYTWKWNTSTLQWDINNSIATGLSTANFYLTYAEFNNKLYIIAGSSSGSFLGYAYMPTAKISSITTGYHDNCLATFFINLSAPLDLGETLTMKTAIDGYTAEVTLIQVDSVTYKYESNVAEGQNLGVKAYEIWDGTILQELLGGGTFYILPAIAPTVINITDSNNYHIFSTPNGHAYNHGLIHYAGYIYGSARNYPTLKEYDIFKLEAADYSNLIQQTIYQNKNGSANRISNFDQIIQAGGFVWVHSDQYLIRLNSTDLDYMVFSGVAAANNGEPPCTDGTYIYLTSGVYATKLDLSALTGTFASYGYDGLAPVAIPPAAILATCNFIQHTPTTNVYCHSSLTDDLYLYASMATSNLNNGYDSTLDIYACHLQKIRKSDMITVGDVTTPKVTDDMVQNSEYLFLAPEFGNTGYSGLWGSTWGLFAIKKTTLEIKYLKNLKPATITDAPALADYGVFYFGNKIVVQNKYYKETYVIDLTNIENWGDYFPQGSATDAIFTFQLNGTDLTVPCNELVLDNVGYVHTNTWENDTLLFKFTLSQLTTAEKVPNIQTTLISSSSNNATVGGYVIDEGQSPITDVGFRYGTDPETLNINVDVSPDSYDFQTELLSLTPGIYYIQAWGVNTEGTWYGNTVVFSTYNEFSLSNEDDDALLEWVNENYGCSIRCVQDAPGVADGVTGTATDQDGNTYNTIVINQKRWFVENLKVTTYRDGTPIPEVTDNAAWAALTDGGRCSFNNE